MMELSEYKNDYYAFTGKLSDINRQIAFAGIAMIWIFKDGNGSEIIIAKNLFTPAILIVLSLTIDMLQYIYQSITWAIFYTIHKRKGKSEKEKVNSPEYLNYPAWFLFSLKILFVVLAYWKLFWFISVKFNP